eukprot:GHVP01023587.1.p1 GENE.GHVP01023587.1~~GHVP01023587.1.p1  ORF type:complete len:543 (+),score=99.75 GHVP01023587.1:401-2029(+)
MLLSGAQCVKLEGPHFDQIASISAHIPVCAHLGLLPQTASSFATVGTSAVEARKIIEQSVKCQEAGASMLVLEKVPVEVASIITGRLRIPTIGIGSGPMCDGQVLVYHDALGLSSGKTLKFAKKFAKGREELIKGLKQFHSEVTTGEFPKPEHSFFLVDKENAKLKKWNSTASSAKEDAKVISRTLDMVIPMGHVNKDFSSKKLNSVNRPKKSKKTTKGKRKKEVVKSNLPSIVRKIESVAVVGGGSIGSFFASSLSQSGHQVTLISDYSDNLEAVRKNNNQIDVIGSEIKATSRPISTISRNEATNLTFDAVFVSSKSDRVIEDMRLAFSLLNEKKGPIILLQNGLIESCKVVELPKDVEVFRGLCYFGANLKVPGQVEAFGERKVVLGPWLSKSSHLHEVESTLRKSGIKVELREDKEKMDEEIWLKFALNGAINALATILRCSNGKLRDEELQPVLMNIFEEIAECSPVKISKRKFSNLLQRTLDETKDNENSFLQDLKKKSCIKELNNICFPDGTKKMRLLESFGHILKFMEKTEQEK